MNPSQNYIFFRVFLYKKNCECKQLQPCNIRKHNVTLNFLKICLEYVQTRKLLELDNCYFVLREQYE